MCLVLLRKFGELQKIPKIWEGCKFEKRQKKTFVQEANKSQRIVIAMRDEYFISMNYYFGKTIEMIH